MLLCVNLKINVSFRENKISIHKSVRLGSEGVSCSCILCVLAGCIGDIVVLKCGRDGGMGYVPGDVYIELGLILCPYAIGGVSGIMAGAAHSDVCIGCGLVLTLYLFVVVIGVIGVLAAVHCLVVVVVCAAVVVDVAR